MDSYAILEPGIDKHGDSARSTSAFEDEFKIRGVPFARALGVLFTIIIILGGAGFVDSLCTARLKALFGFSLAVASSFILFALAIPHPYPCTFSNAKQNGLHSIFSVLFCLYHGILIGIVTAILTMAALYNFVPMKDLLNWSCESDDDDDSSRSIFHQG